jgi:phospholipid/cholesterol/gamma-HCH transport system substrate-binding protein
MKKMNLEMIVGLFLLTGFASFSFIAIKMGDINLFMKDSYPVSARFVSISGLKEGAVVELAGVKVGKVSGITLDAGDYEAVVHLDISKAVRLSDQDSRYYWRSLHQADSRRVGGLSGPG